MWDGLGIGLDRALWKSDIGCKTLFPRILAQEGTPRPRTREKPQDRPGREQGRGVRGKSPSPDFPNVGASAICYEEICDIDDF
ncbi:hypothetical protein DMR_09600 [Solidesulfovibrio magneticus RS-1]|uniref:Uncharacterized protein n=1 Tax=Solidesulfovibrio magneticus (strain ATCC 700980 / DSM 13731 / RS-1) TaxID=573370 RepID=C4XKR2_SOLM1|nr:hypothetical protein DMR_09600 [Solidesulfovibrio magneticus RS-1]